MTAPAYVPDVGFVAALLTLDFGYRFIGFDVDAVYGGISPVTNAARSNRSAIPNRSTLFHWEVEE